MTDDVIQLKRPEEVGERVSIALHLMVKNGASVVGRLLDCAGPYLTEVVAVLNDCTDATRDVIAEKCRQLLIPTSSFHEVTRASHPELYLLDVPETYRKVGRPLVGEVYEGPHTGQMILADWAAARNVGWQACHADWRLFLDADDVVDDPYCLPGLVKLLEERGLEAAATRYHFSHTAGGVSRADAFRERLCRNRPEITWQGVVHERLAGYAPDRVAYIDGNLVVRDLRDSTGTGIRIPGRNLKILYHAARRADWNISARHMIYLAAEARVCMPALSLELVRRHLAGATWAEEKAWAAAIAGEIRENEEDFGAASVWYERSLALHPGVMAAMRLARARFRQGEWELAVKAYERGLANRGRPQFLDNGLAYEDATKILVAAALRKLGRLEEAARLSGEARAKFPESETLRELDDKLAADRRKLGG